MGTYKTCKREKKLHQHDGKKKWRSFGRLIDQKNSPWYYHGVTGYLTSLAWGDEVRGMRVPDSGASTKIRAQLGILDSKPILQVKIS